MFHLKRMMHTVERTYIFNELRGFAMKLKKLIADELQCMFLNDDLIGFREEYINDITMRLRNGEIKLFDLMSNEFQLKEKVLEVLVKINKEKLFYP